MEHREDGQQENKWTRRQAVETGKNREMANKAISWLNKYKNIFIKIFFITILVALTIRGLGGYWEDFKDYAVKARLEEQSDLIIEQTPVVKEEPVIKKESKPIISLDKNKEIKERIFREKGIILSDDDIQRYSK